MIDNHIPKIERPNTTYQIKLYLISPSGLCTNKIQEFYTEDGAKKAYWNIRTYWLSKAKGYIYLYERKEQEQSDVLILSGTI